MKFKFIVGVFTLVLFIGCDSNSPSNDGVDSANATYKKPSMDECINQGGEYDALGYNECLADRATAKRICTLPDDTQWREVLQTCGYGNYSSDKHDEYLRCINSEGYHWNLGYWSATSFEDTQYVNTLAHYADTYSAQIESIGSNAHLYVRCLIE